MFKPTLESAFAAAAPQTEVAAAVCRLRERFEETHRTYHNEVHTVDVLTRLYDWTAGGAPSVSLLAAALYHDAIYDPTRSDNEARSAELCADELAKLALPRYVIARSSELILVTAHHLPPVGDADAVLLTDADLYVLGGSEAEYDSYRRAVRAEYAHVSEDAWRVGRARVMERFLERPHIFHGNWTGVESREAWARNHISEEIMRLQVQDNP